MDVLEFELNIYISNAALSKIPTCQLLSFPPAAVLLSAAPHVQMGCLLYVLEIFLQNVE